MSNIFIGIFVIILVSKAIIRGPSRMTLSVFSNSICRGQWFEEIDVFFRFVDICGIDDHHCLDFHLIIFAGRKFYF